MQSMPLHRLRPGMVVGRSIFTADGSVLLAAGVKLTHRYVRRLQQLGVGRVFIWDPRTRDIEFSAPIQDSTRIRAARNVRRALTLLGREAGNSHYAQQLLAQEMPALETTVEEILSDLLGSDKLVLEFYEVKNTDDYTFQHSVNVCLLSLLAGRRLNLPEDELKKLGLGAMLHDVGKVMVPAAILKKPGPLDQEEFQLMRKHPRLGQLLLDHNSQLNPDAASIAAQHHERFDGTGYPYGLKGSEMHPFARLAAICDVFDALTSDRVYRPRYQPHEAVEYIMGAGGTHFDYDMVQAFTRCVAMYPLGTIVRLNTGEEAVVIQTGEQVTYRPVVRVLKDCNGREVKKPYELNLRFHPEVFIERVF